MSGKNKINMKIKNTVNGTVEIITFDKFINKLQCSSKKHDSSQPKIFNTLLRYEDDDSSQTKFESNTAHYQQVASGWCNTNDELKSSVISQCGVHHRFMKNIKEMAEDMCVRHMEDYGEPNFFVQIAPRLYLVASLEDWKLHQSSDGKKAISGTARLRNHLVSIERLTEERIGYIAQNIFKE